MIMDTPDYPHDATYTLWSHMFSLLVDLSFAHGLRTLIALSIICSQVLIIDALTAFFSCIHGCLAHTAIAIGPEPTRNGQYSRYLMYRDTRQQVCLSLLNVD